MSAHDACRVKRKNRRGQRGGGTERGGEQRSERRGGEKGGGGRGDEGGVKDYMLVTAKKEERGSRI